MSYRLQDVSRYSDLPRLRTGDLLLFRGTRLFSKVIRYWTSSVYSHVGVVIYVRPAFSGRGRWCCLAADETKGGVVLEPLDRLLEECQREGCQVDWFAPRAAGGLDREKIAQAMLDMWGDAYASPLQFVYSFGKLAGLVLRWLGKGCRLNAHREFCSMAAGQALYAGGCRYLDFDRLPPGKIAELPQLELQGELVA